MTRSRGEGTVRQRKDGLFEARKNIVAKGGVRKRVSGYGKTAKAAVEDRDAKCRALQAGEPIKSSTATIAEIASQWREVALPAYKTQSTRDTYAARCKKWVEANALGTVRLRDLDAQHVQRWINTSTAAQSSKRQDLIILRAVLDMAVQRKLIAANPARTIALPHVEQVEADILSIQQVTALLEEIEKRSRYATAVRLTALTGARRGEILGLRWRDIDLATGEIRIRGTIVGSGKTLHRQEWPKGKRPRTVKVPPEMIALLKRHKASQAAEKLAALAWLDKEGLAFTTSVGTPVDGRNLLRVVQTAARRLRFDEELKIGVHTLRHSTATHLIYTAGVPVDVVQRLLGHANVKTTLTAYGHPSALDVADAVSKMGSALSGVVTPESTPETSENDPESAAGNAG